MTESENQSMPISVTCYECSATHRVRNDAVGRRIKCKGCGKSITVELPDRSDRNFDLHSSSTDNLLETTNQAWRLCASTRSTSGGMISVIVLLIALVGLESSRWLLRESMTSLEGWFVFAFCLPLSLLFAYQAATSFWGKLEITVQGDRKSVV